ncbi:MAG: DUF362 domain-containing protein [Candidatus Bathyarchaeia archaeon]
MSKVAIVKGLSPVEMISKALEMIKSDLGEVLSSKKPILIKPNYIVAKHPSTGMTTDSKVVEGVVKYLKDHGIDDITIGEGSGWADTFEAFKVAEIDKVANKYNVRIVDLNKDRFVEVYPPNPLALKKVLVAETALKSCIISVPKLKVHRLTLVTLGIKNMMGALASKGSMHNGKLHENIADLASVLRPSLTVIDGIIAGEGNEVNGNPVKMNLVIAGTDPVAVDAVGAAVMDIPPTEVRHLALAEKKGLGTCRLDEVEIVGEPIDKVKRKFRITA